MITAYEAFEMILDTNELIDKIKGLNTDIVPNPVHCQTVDLLVKYRELLGAEMKKTWLGVFEDDDK